MMLKKIIAAFALIFCMNICAYAEEVPDENILPLLNALNIMTGDNNGNYHLDDLVTRAEFTKIAIAASPSKDTVALALNISPFSDVKFTDWFAPYVKAAVNANLVEGYIDGSFRPYNNVSYEEAVTMLLRALGYTSDDFGDSWPYGQIGMANSLEISKNVGANVGEAITRRQAARLVYNTLDAKKKDSSQKLLSIFDCEVTEGATIIASHNEDSSLGIDKIYTTKGILDIGSGYTSDYVGRQGDLITKNGDDFLAFTPNVQTVESYAVTNVIGNDLIIDGQVLSINENTTAYFKSQTLTYETLAAKANKGDTLKVFKNSKGSIDYVMLVQTSVNGSSGETLDKYVIYSLLDNAVIGYKNGSFIQIDIKDTTTCYKDTTRSTYSAIKNEMEMGDILYVKMNGASVDYVNYEKGNMEGPVMVLSSDWMSSLGANSSTQIMRDGAKASQSAVLANDIAYYSPDLNMVLVYSDKVTGIYEDASPTKDAPTKVKISGKEYGIESVSAFNALSSNGSAKIGDTITVALGRDGRIAGVVNGSAGSTKIGYLTDAGKKVMTDTNGNSYTGYYAVIVGADGASSEYEVDRDYSQTKGYIGSVCKASFNNKKTTISIVNSTGGISGRVSADSYTIGSTPVAPNAKILDTVVVASYDYTMYKRIYLQRLDSLTLDSNRVMYCDKNAAGEITELILRDVTGDAYSYGLVASAQSAGESKIYTIDVKGTSFTYNRNSGIASKVPVKVYMNGTQIENASKLLEYSGTISELNDTSCTIGSTKYLLSSEVTIYYIDASNNARMITMDEAKNGNYKLNAYYDKEQSSGGRIRVITAR